MTNQYTTKYISHARSHKATPGAMAIATCQMLSKIVLVLLRVENLEKGKVCIHIVSTQKQIANSLIKALAETEFDKLKKSIVDSEAITVHNLESGCGKKRNVLESS